MSKVKWSFSLIFAIFLVGILSTAAFASDPYNLRTVQNGSDLEVSFTGNSNDSTDIAGRQFELVLMDGAKVVNQYGPVSLNSSNQGAYNIPSGDLTAGKVYTIELYHIDDTTTVLAVSSGLVIGDPHNSKLYQKPDPHVDVSGTGLVNSNATGFNNLKKQRSGQSVHGFYQNNTNSCASCHQTHTAANGESLLFKDGIYSTCSACHDGTTGAYNSFSPTSSSTSNNVAGTFDVSSDVHGSLHQADGSLKITAAPGGNSDPTSKIWNQDFDCASCHAPHGGGTAEENNLNIDPLGWGGIQYVSAKDGGTIDQQSGKLFKGIPIYDKADIPPAMDTPYILVRDYVTQTDVNDNYFYSRAKVPGGSDIIQTYRWDSTIDPGTNKVLSKYVPDSSLWLRDTGHKNAPFQNANTVLKDKNGNDVTTNNLTVIWRDGFAFGTGASSVVSADLSIGIDVETTGDVRSLYDSSFKVVDRNGNVNPAKSYIPDSGVEMTKYCTACHTDFSLNTATNESGVLTAFHRHTGITDALTCVRCHFAHGTKSSIMKDSTDNLATIPDTLSSGTHSSALRRYTDLNSCYTGGCHSTDSTNSLYLDNTINNN